MPTCLDPIWDDYQTARNGLKAVGRCVRVSDVTRGRAFRNTRIHGLTDDAC